MTRSQVFLFLAAAVLVLAVMRSSAAPMYPDERLPRGNTTEFAIARGKLFTHVFARGKDGQLWYRYQPTSSASPNWTDWQSLPAPEGGRWDSDPAVGVNADGSLEVFVRWSTNLDLWQVRLLDPTKPTAFERARECSCVDMEECKNKTLNPPSKFWNTQPAFPTSNPVVMQDADGNLEVWYRGFNGQMFRVRQRASGDGSIYYPPESMGVQVFV